MSEYAVIHGKSYAFVKKLLTIGDCQHYILCTDTQGEECLCEEQLWLHNTIPTERSAPVTTHSSTQEKLSFFLSLFQGREGIYARRFYSTKTGKSGYSPVCKNEWTPEVCNKKKYRCAYCPNREFMPLTAEIVKAHLMGRDPACRDVVAIYPIREDNTTCFLAVDFDDDNWQADVTAFRKCAESVGLTPAVERSRSGNGAHVWFFFTEPVPAADARRLGSGLLTQAMSVRHELSFSSYDRLFPTQDTVPKGGFGNLIALPFQGQAQKNGNSLFVDAQFQPYNDQWAFLSSLPKIDAEQLTVCLKNVCRDGDMGVMVETDEPPLPWQHRHSSKKLDSSDFPYQVKLTISNMVYIEKAGFSQASLNVIKRLSAFSNPEYRVKQAMRLPVYNIPRVLFCGYEDDSYVGIPRGCMEPLVGLLEQHGVPFAVDDLRKCGHPIDVTFNGTLRPEQEPAANALLENDIGVLSATTAFGKTVIGAYLIGQIKTNTLILVQSSALLDQWKSALNHFLDVHEELPELPRKRGRKKTPQVIGQIGAGKNNRNGIVDIAIMQSLFEGKDKTVKQFVSEYGMVLVDECHHIAAFTFEQILKAVEAKYIYGLSATPVRKDGHHPIIFMQCGPVRYLVDAKSQAEKRTFSHYVIPRFTGTRLAEAGTIQEIYSAITENRNRNTVIIEDTVKLVQEGRTPILLTERKEHAILLAEALKAKIQNVYLLIGSEGQKLRREKLASLKEVPGTEDLAIVATGKYIGEGFDSPRLDTMLLAMPISWKGTLAQYAGRLHRNYEGKQEVRIYDYVDIKVPALERMYHKRLKGYAELGYQVKFGASDNSASVIYNGYSATAAFEKDLSSAQDTVLIFSPFVRINKVQKLSPLLREFKEKCITVAIHTKSPDAYESDWKEDAQAVVKLLEDEGIPVVLHDELHYRYAVIDGRIVWYGNVDFLAYGKKETDVLRFVNNDIADELVAMAQDTYGEQMMIDDL